MIARSRQGLRDAAWRAGRGRRGLSLLEVIVVIAIVLALAAVAIPAINAMLQLEQRRAAKDLALTYEMLHDEAVLRNITFRVAYHLDGNYYQVEAGDPETLIFADPDERAAFEEERAAKLKRFTKREIEEGAAEDPENSFAVVPANFRTRVNLPNGTRFGGVYTAQHHKMVEPSGTEEDPDEPLIMYSYVFPNGFAEHTIVQLVEAGDPQEGFTIEIESLSGRVHLHPEVMAVEDLRKDLPEEGPELAN